VTVPLGPEPVLSLSEWIVLSLVCEGVTHGNAVTQHLARYGDLGYVWNVQKAVVYRSLDRLGDLGLVRPVRGGALPEGAGPAAGRGHRRGAGSRRDMAAATGPAHPRHPV
jgi:hypothetical protein